MEDKNRICPVERAEALDVFIRKLVQSPSKMLKPYIKSGMTVLDVGCGPGFFSVEIAKMCDRTVNVIAADLQEGMLEKVRKKIVGTQLEEKIQLHKCQKDRLGVTDKVDFVLAFYMVHEVPDQDKFFSELKSLLNSGGKILIVEPKFHVSEESFKEMIGKLEKEGFEVEERPKIFFSRSVVVGMG